MNKLRILVFASGSKDNGGSGFKEMVEQSRTNPPILDAIIVGVVSNHAKGGVRQKAEEVSIPFKHFPGPFTAENYRAIKKEFKPDFVMLSGWLQFVRGFDPRTTINIHPGPTGKFGGEGMYGHYVHEATIAAFKRGEIKESAVTMHFADEVAYDNGPVIFKLPVLIRPDDTAETLAARVNEKERAWQSYILNLVVHKRIGLIEIQGEWLVKCNSANLRFIIPGLS